MVDFIIQTLCLLLIIFSISKSLSSKPVLLVLGRKALRRCRLLEDFRVICLWLQFVCEVIFAIFIRYVRAFPLIFLISASVSGLASLYSELRIWLTPQGQRGIIERSLRRYPERQSVLDMSTVNSIVQQSNKLFQPVLINNVKKESLSVMVWV